MLRKIISAVVVVIALIILFFLVKTAINAFRDEPKPTAPVQTEATVTDPPENPASETGGTEPKKTAQSLPATNGGSATSNSGTSGSGSTTGNNSTTNRPANTPATTPGGAPTTQPLASAGPAETVTAIIATTFAVGTVLVVRRRQLANL